jgi:2-C-methyl-D-erythritol 4-phosphate cytidylyltransferase
MVKVAVIIPAAGASSRFGGAVKKPFMRMDDRPLFLRTLELFVNRDDVCQTILAVSPDDYDMVKEKYGPNLGFMAVTLVKGGSERYETVRKAIDVVEDGADLIAIHDAVRPCLTAERISEVFDAADKFGAAILAAPVTDTLKRGDGEGAICGTVDREGLFMAQTPQVFKADLIRQAYRDLPDDQKNITDDAQVAELAGHKVKLVNSDLTNIKITVQADIRLAMAILNSLPKPKPKKALNPFEEAQW